MNINNIDYGEASQFILAYLQENGIEAYQEPGWSDTLVRLARSEPAKLRITAYTNGQIFAQATITDAGQFGGSIFDPECFPKLLTYVKGIVEQYSI